MYGDMNRRTVIVYSLFYMYEYTSLFSKLGYYYFKCNS